jgi:hypothetical protein
LLSIVYTEENERKKMKKTIPKKEERCLTTYVTPHLKRLQAGRGRNAVALDTKANSLTVATLCVGGVL